MRVGIIGARKVENEKVVSDVLGKFITEYVCFVGGGSKGAERLARDWATANGFDYILFKPYNFIDPTLEHHPKYFSTRNKQIVDNSDYVVIFFDDAEGGIKKILEYVKNYTKKPFMVINNSGDVLDARVGE